MLTPFQRQVAEAFLAMPEAHGFALAGGAALILHQVVDRTTRDLDLFADDLSAVRAATDAFMATAETRSWTVEVVRSGPAFSRMRVAGPTGATLVDLGYDHRWLPAERSEVGPVLSVAELGVDKLLALFGRAEARDFVDVFRLAGRLGIERMLADAGRKDTGFDPYHLAINLDSIDRHRREDFALDDHDHDAMREFFSQLRVALIDETLSEDDPPPRSRGD